MAIARAEESPWGLDPSNPLNQQRSRQVSGRLLECFKQGDLPLKQGKKVQFSVVQRGPVSGRIADDYGPWSRIDLDAKGQVLLFCNRPDPRADPAETFGRGCELAVGIPDASYPFAIEDVRLATELSKRPGFPRLLAEAPFKAEMAERRRSAGPLLARFLIDETPTREPNVSPDLLYDLLEAPDANVLFRATLLSHLVEKMSLAEDVAAPERARLVRAMVQVLREPAKVSQTLHEGIRQAYLANTVFQQAGTPYLPADRVFPETKERDAAAALLRGHQFPDDQREQLAAWLKRR
jgi:hypothetical protein